MVPKIRAAFFVLVTLLVGLTTSGCDDDKTKAKGPTARVSVTARDTGEPLAGIKILAVDPNTNTPLAGPLFSDENGEASFGLLPREPLRFLVFGGLDWLVHSQEDWSGWQSPGSATAGPTALEPITDGVARIVMRRGPPEDGLPRLSGRIVDAVTGAPLPQVVIGTRPFLTAYNSDTDPGADVTGVDGTFAVHEIIFARNLETGTLFQLQPLFVSKAGYRTIDWYYPNPLGVSGLNIIDLEIRLTPLSATDNSSAGVKATYYTLNGGPVLAYQPGTNIVVPQLPDTTSYTLQFWSEDLTGNVEGVNTKVFTVHGQATIRLVWSNSDIDGSPCTSVPGAAVAWTIRSGTILVATGSDGCPDWSGVNDVLVSPGKTYSVTIDWYWDGGVYFEDQVHYPSVAVPTSGEVLRLQY
jgi:hypothetical protein